MKAIARKGSREFIRVNGSIKQCVEVLRNRLVFTLVIFALSYSAIGYRMLALAMSDGSGVRSHVLYEDDITLQVARKDIVDRNGTIVATNLRTASLYANPKQIKDPQEAAKQLIAVLKDIDYETVLERLAGERSFVWLKRNLTPHEQYAVNNLGIPGFHFREEEKRIYPHGSLLSHLLGVVGMEGEGLSGIERAFNRQLSETGDSKPLRLTVDMRVQSIVHQVLEKHMKQYEAKGAAAIVMDANTADIVAMVSLPDFDPNMPAKIETRNMFNRATYGVYEMGSTMKVLTVATALDTGMVQPQTIYDVTKPIHISRFSIRDHHMSKTPLNVTEILAQSSNIGSAKIAQEMGAQVQQNYFSRFGLLDMMQIDLPERSSPLYPDRWGEISTMTASYGHGIAITPLHLTSAVSAVVNGGFYRSPEFVKKDGRQKTTVRVLKEKTSDTMRALLRHVVDKGTGSRAEVKGYFVGGKTGTAEKAIEGGYDRRAMIASFVGVFPMQEPEYVVFVMVDEPRCKAGTLCFQTGGWVSAPIVGEIIAGIGPVLGVKPVDENGREIKTWMQASVRQ